MVFYSKAAAHTTSPLPTFPGLKVWMWQCSKDYYDVRVPTTCSEAIQIFQQFKDSQWQYDPQRDELDIFYESILLSILHYSDALNSKFSLSSPSLFANELSLGEDIFDFNMQQTSPNIPNAEVNTTSKALGPLEPEDISKPQSPVDSIGPVGPSKPVTPINTQASSKQASPTLDKDQDEEPTWKQLAMLQSSTLSDSHCPHSFVDTIATPNWSYSQPLDDHLYAHFSFSPLDCESLCYDDALKWEKVCKTLGDTVHQVENKNQLCIRAFMSHLITNHTSVEILQQLCTFDISTCADFSLENSSSLCARLLVHNGLKLYVIQASGLQTVDHHG